jgi:tRNA A37 threonylcarbamoyladenosine dehydratase
MLSTEFSITNKTLNKKKMAEWTERAELYLKKEGLDKLHNANVLIVGLGGIFAAEFWLEQEAMTIVDGDVVDITNINRHYRRYISTVS